jgi:hypothetical protein
MATAITANNQNQCKATHLASCFLSGSTAPVMRDDRRLKIIDSDGTQRLWRVNALVRRLPRDTAAGEHPRVTIDAPRPRDPRGRPRAPARTGVVSF